MTRTLYRGGAVYSPADPFATALVVDGGSVAWVGSDDAAEAGGDAVDAVVELDGALVAPAFVDGHVHTTETGLALTGVALGAARSVAEMLDAVAGAARRGGGGPVLGHGWDERRLAEGRPPTRQELDRAAGGAEVYLSRVDVHSAVVSTALAERAGVAGLQGWDDAGRVERDAHHAARATTRALPASRREELQRTALRAAAAAGIAAVHEMSAPHVAPSGDLAALLRLVDGEPALPAVVAHHGALAASEEEARALVVGLGLPESAPLAGLAGDLCVDGSVGSRTAAYREDYADAPGARGHLYLSRQQVRDHVAACAHAGLQAGFHVIGDAAVEAVLAALEELGPGVVGRARVRLEHVEALEPQAVVRLSRLPVTASVQPAFDAAWGGPQGMYAERLGSARAARMNPFAELAAAGVPLVLGSDSPVTPFDPWGAVRACAFHTVEEQRISARAAFLAHTRGGWRAVGRPDVGVLVPGAPATLAVWEAGELVVQAPDDRIQAWSTDVRSGTPGLPDLTPGRPLPRCLRTLREGVVLHDAAALA